MHDFTKMTNSGQRLFAGVPESSWDLAEHSFLISVSLFLLAKPCKRLQQGQGRVTAVRERGRGSRLEREQNERFGKSQGWMPRDER